MTTYNKTVDGDYIVAVTKQNGGMGAITETEYNAIRTVIAQAPVRRTGFRARLRADTLEWEYVPVDEPAEPEDPDLSAEEALEIIVGGESDEAE